MAFNPACPCHERPIPNRPVGFHSMGSSEMRAYGEAHTRPDIVLHADCVEQRERLDHLSNDFAIMCGEFSDLHRLPEELQEKIRTVNVFFMSGHWEGHYPFPADGMIAEAERLMELVETAVIAADPTHDIFTEMSRLMTAGTQPPQEMYDELARLAVANLQPSLLRQEVLPDSTVTPFAGQRRRLETSDQPRFTGSAHRLQ